MVSLTTKLIGILEIVMLYFNRRQWSHNFGLSLKLCMALKQ